MMRQMREHTKWIMLLVAVAFVALMVFEWGMDLSGRSSAQASGGEVGRIDGDPISNEEFLAVYRNLYNQQQAAQEEPISRQQNEQIEEAAWEQLVMDRLIQREIARRGVRATEAEIRQAARFAPPPEFMGNELFQTEGQFDLRKYHQFLSSPTVDPQLLLQLESYYRDVIPRTKLMRQVVAGVYVPDSELWRLFQERRETARVRFVALDPDALVPDAQAQVSESEIAQYHREHEEEFERPAQATLGYVVIPKEPVAADTAAALARAQQVRQRILGGADFAEVAREVSSDRGSAARGGSLGTFGRGQMVPAFEQAAFSQPVGQVGEPVLSQFGYHIIQVESREGDQVTARHILLPIELSDAREEQLLDLADRLEELGESTGLEAAARELGLSVRTGTIAPQIPTMPVVGVAFDAADWAFDDEPEVGETSPVFENETAFYMVQLKDRIEARTLGLEEAAPQIRAYLVREKKLEKVHQIGAGLVQQVRSGTPLEQAAQAAGLQVQEAGPFTRLDFVPGLGQGTPAVGAAFGLDAGETSGVVEAAGAPAIVQLVEKTEASREEFEAQKAAFRAATMATQEQQRWSQFVASLRREAEVVDLREELERQAELAANQQPRGPF